MPYEDIIYDKAEGIATVTMNRPDVLNAFRGKTVHEMIDAFRDAWYDRTIGVVILTARHARSIPEAINRFAAAAVTRADES